MKKRVIITLGIVLLTVIPAFVMLGVTYLATGTAEAAALWASMPAIVGIAAAAGGGRRFAVIVAIVMGLLAPLTIVAGASPVAGAALMALMAIMVGRMSRFGLQKSALMAPVMLAWTLISPPTWDGQALVDRTDNAYLLWMAAIFFVGAIIPALIVPRLLRKRPLPGPVPHSRAEAMPYTVIITVLATVSTYYVLDNPRMYGGAFLIAAIFVLAPIGDAQTLRPTLLRIGGTVLGSVFVLALVSQIDSLGLIYLCGIVFITIAVLARFGSHGWLYYVFMMPATASLNATTLSQVGQLGEQRVVDNVVGGVLVLIAAAAAAGYSHWASRHGRTDDGDEESAAAAKSLPSLT